jgi:hypothetical protein
MLARDCYRRVGLAQKKFGNCPKPVGLDDKTTTEATDLITRKTAVFRVMRLNRARRVCRFRLGGSRQTKHRFGKACRRTRRLARVQLYRDDELRVAARATHSPGMALTVLEACATAIDSVYPA